MTRPTKRETMPTSTLETDRVIMRLPTDDDVPAILRFYRENEEHLAPYEPTKPVGFYTAWYWEGRVASVHEEFRRGLSWRTFLFDKRSPDVVIGSANFSNVVRGAAHFCTLGYSLSATAQGQGYLTEALSPGVEYAFETLQLHRIQANYMPHNVRSGKLLRRLGFHVEGYARDYLLIAGKWEDHVLTGRINPNWVSPER